MDSEELVLKISRLRKAFVFASYGGPILSAHPRAADMLEALGLPTRGRLTLGRKFGQPYEFRLDDYFHPEPQINEDGSAVRPDKLHNWEMVRTWAKIMVLEVGDWIKKNLPQDHNPLFEFVRHIRNAVAHGEIFEIRSLRYEAQFAGLHIREDMHGSDLWDFVHDGDIFALIDAVEARVISIEKSSL